MAFNDHIDARDCDESLCFKCGIQFESNYIHLQYQVLSIQAIDLDLEAFSNLSMHGRLLRQKSQKFSKETSSALYSQYFKLSQNRTIQISVYLDQIRLQKNCFDCNGFPDALAATLPNVLTQ